MLPIVLPENLIIPFNFYLHYGIRRGMRYQNELYGLVHEFAVDDRLKAYQRACELIEQEIPVVVTASSTRYAIWVSLRSPSTVSKPIQEQILPAAVKSAPSGLYSSVDASGV